MSLLLHKSFILVMSLAKWATVELKNNTLLKAYIHNQVNINKDLSTQHLDVNIGISNQAKHALKSSDIFPLVFILPRRPDHLSFLCLSVYSRRFEDSIHFNLLLHQRLS